MSASNASRRAISCARLSFMLRVILFLFRLCTYHQSEFPSLSTRHLRIGSPSPGASILMTSAPNSANIRAQKGPAIKVPSSSTLIPAIGPTEADSLFFLFIMSSGKVVEDCYFRCCACLAWRVQWFLHRHTQVHHLRARHALYG